MQCGFELLAVRLTQRSALCAVDDPVQLFHIHLDEPARKVLLHHWASKLRKCGVSGLTKHLFEGTVRPLAGGIFAAARGQAEKLPVGGPITRAAKTARIDEGLRRI